MNLLPISILEILTGKCRLRKVAIEWLKAMEPDVVQATNAT